MTFNIKDFEDCYSIVLVTVDEENKAVDVCHVCKIFKTLNGAKAYCSYKNLTSRRSSNQFYDYVTFGLYKNEEK